MVNSINQNYNKAILTNASNNSYFGKINSNCYFLKTPTNITNFSNVLFILEESYFVKVKSRVDDFYYCEYLNLTGYVSKENITLINEQVENPYLTNITFNVFKATNLYKEPILNSSLIIAPLPENSTLNYIGKIYSEKVSEISSNTWYYCKININNNIVYGYVHESFTENLTPITKLKLSVSELNETSQTNLLNLKTQTQIIIIVIISVPILFLLYLLLKGFKKV